MIAAQAIPSGTAPPPERLLRGLEAQAVSDAQSLAGYQELFASTADPDIRLLLDVIVADKQRLLDRLQWMTRGFGGDAKPGPRIESTSDGDLETDADAVDEAALVRSLMRDEREGARYLRHLARQEPTFGRGVYALLLEAMAREGGTHWRVLQFVLHRVDAARAVA